ncbi:L-dopachrome tautomerase-related protein [uncultured Aureimonas sp.]|uniref:L-dopachrome tautomerase-related protein n=1 Tax=uncultured Aureimonas sp. TaxID=1604662 RepID=UPI0025FEBBC1|nr:L-dopachrome tautomerase-related protein [uncultured Aureimonas sp.]
MLARRRFLASTLTALAALPFAARAAAAQASPAPAASSSETADTAREVGTMELALLADAPSTPTGLAISARGRVFVMMPRFTGDEPYTLGEVAPDGSVTPYPDAASNRPDPERAQATFFHVPNGVFDRDDRLWLLDAGLPQGSGSPVAGAAKLVQIDIETGTVLKIVPLDPGVEPTSSLNDLRIDIADGRARAFVTDQGQDGQGAVLAVDLDTGRVVRRLGEHASTRSQKGVAKFVEHRPVMRTSGSGKPTHVQGGANGIALGPGGHRLYYAPLMGRRLYAVDAASLLDTAKSDADIAAGVEDLGEKGLTGGLGADAQDRIYLTLQEQNAIGRRHPGGTLETIASDPRLIWADTIVITADGWLYVSAAQVNRRPEYNGGADLQKPPYAVLRVRIDAGPA